MNRVKSRGSLKTSLVMALLLMTVVGAFDQSGLTRAARLDQSTPVVESTVDPTSTASADPTEIPATFIPTEEPVVATVGPTSETPATIAATEVPPITTTAPTLVPEVTETVEGLIPGTPEASPSATPTNVASTVTESFAIASAGDPFTVNGQTGNVTTTPVDGLTFYVGDLVDMAGWWYRYSESWVGTSGWDAGAYIAFYSGSDCQGSVYSRLDMTNDGSFNFFALQTSPQLGFFSVRVSQFWAFNYNYGENSRGSSDISNCVNVAVVDSVPSLTGNGNRVAIDVEEGAYLTLAVTNLPPTTSRTDLIRWSGACGIGTATVVSTSLPYTMVASPSGSSYFEVFAYSGNTFLGKSDCFTARIADVTARFVVNGSEGPISYAVGQTFDLYGSGFAPNAQVSVVYFDANGMCSGPATVLSHHVADAFGAVDSPDGLVFRSANSDYALQMSGSGETSNCIAFSPSTNVPRLTVGGSSGPFVYSDATEVFLQATGLPPLVESHLITCSGRVLDEFGSTTSATGEESAYYMAEDEYSSVAFRADGVTTNCLKFHVIDIGNRDLNLDVNGSAGPVTVTIDTPFTVNVEGFPENSEFNLNVYHESGDCSGARTTLVFETTSSGEFAFDTAASNSGTYSYQGTFGEGKSNCVRVNVQDPPTPTPEPTSTPTPLPTPTETPIPPPTATPSPTAWPTPIPTSTPTPLPTSTPTPAATSTPTPLPTSAPIPTSTPTQEPTATPTLMPTQELTATPTSTPTLEPTATSTPTQAPTATVTPSPTPTQDLTLTPTPTSMPTQVPTVTPTSMPTQAPTATPTPVFTVGSVRVVISTRDGGALPDSIVICVGDQCFTLNGEVVMRALVNASSAELTIDDVPEGAVEIALTGTSPYAEIHLIAELRAGEALDLPITLERVELSPTATVPANPTAQPTVATTPGAGVTGLPNTGGVGSSANGRAETWLFLATLLSAVLALVCWRRRAR